MNRIYFIGIGGIGMSALARYYNNMNWKVFGYDKTETALTKKLVSEGMKIHYVDDVDLLEKDVEMVVYTPAIPENNIELCWYREEGYILKKRSEVLGLISAGVNTIAIAGTHGKTTTSSMLAHVLMDNDFEYTGFIGGVSVAKGSNFVSGNGDWVLLEADEYDRSFLHLSPQIASLMSLDPDHLDIYKDEAGMLEGFRAFTGKIRQGGKLFVKLEDASVLGEEWLSEMSVKDVEVIRFGEGGDVNCSNIRVVDGSQRFDYRYRAWKMDDVASAFAGKHNVENACVAISIALDLGLDVKKVRHSIEGFEGVKRRFELIVDDGNKVMIDDYAHHPTELKVTIDAVRSLFPKKKILGVFQPHLYSRTLDFYQSFAKSLEGLDELLLLEIYPAREEPIKGVSSKLIFDEIEMEKKNMVVKKDLLNHIDVADFDVLVTLGAGDIGEMVVNIAKKIIK